MKKAFWILLAVAGLIVLSAASLLAGEGVSEAVRSYAALGAGVAITAGAGGGGIGIGLAGLGATLGVSRNPAIGGRIMTLMIISMALSESCAIYALVIAFMLYGKV